MIDYIETWTSDWITEWMFNYLKKIDEYVESILQTISLNEKVNFKHYYNTIHKQNLCYSMCSVCVLMYTSVIEHTPSLKCCI